MQVQFLVTLNASINLLKNHGNHMKKFGLFFFLSLPHLSFAVVCHPKIDPERPQYVIGYGSLIDEQSKKNTDPSAQESFPILVKGYKRSWSVHGTLPGLNTTFLSISEDKNASVNGVIYKLDNPVNIQLYDKRERAYCRKELNVDQIKVYSAALPNQKQIWIYTSKQKTNDHPTHNFPIVQSYVDLFLRGCIQIEEKFKINNFARDCIKNTDQWSNHWENDRIFPRRPFVYQPYAIKVDMLLKEMLPENFKHIK